VFNANYTNEKANEMIVFTKNKTSIITERKGKRISVYSNDSILKNIDDNFAIKSYMIANFCKINKKKSISNLYYFKGKKILVIDSAAVYLQDKKPDVLILINSPKISLERVFKSWKPEIVVADASNYKSYIKIWKGTCEKEKIPFHATAEKGFYKL
jgi:competence protein ComEC